jgi:hypothetical protein
MRRVGLRYDGRASSRKELYDLVWSEPLRTLCSRFGISDVALKKTCARSEIPTPERGYWAKKDAGKPTFQVALPIRPPGMDNQVLIAAGQSYWYQDWKKGELLGLLPPPPEFPEPIEAVRERVAKAMGKVSIPAGGARLAPCNRPSPQRS